MTGLKGNTIVVTGARGGIGEAIVADLTGVGARVVAVDLKPPIASDDSVEHVVGDVRREEVVREAVEAATAQDGNLIGLVTCALSLGRVSLAETDLDQARDTFDVMLFGAWSWQREFAQCMQKPGAAVHVGSVHSERAALGFGAYAAAKAGLASFVRTAAVEWGPEGIRTNGVMPGFVPVRRNEHHWRDTEELARQVRSIPSRRVTQPADVASVVSFLLGDGARAINGVMLPVDGGLLAAFGGEV